MFPKGCQNQPKWIQKGAKVSQDTFKDTPCGTGSKKLGKRGAAGIIRGAIFDQKSIEIQSTKSLKNQSPKNIKLMPQGCQHGAKIDAKTH